MSSLLGETDRESSSSPTEYGDVKRCVDGIVEQLGNEITVATPLGIGKPNYILNELVRRAVENPEFELTILSALSMAKPDWDSELERRLAEPLTDRLFGDYPELEYTRLLRNGNLPDNVEVHEFYFQPGAHLGNGPAQQAHHNVNYTHVARAIGSVDIDLFAQLVGVGEYEGERYYNLGSNADVTPAEVEATREWHGDDVMVVGEVNRNMPFMYGSAPVAPEEFDAVLDADRYDFPLFGPPNTSVSLADYAIGLRVSALLADGGTLQIGIGSLGDAIGAATDLRHHSNEVYRDLLDALDIDADCGDLVSAYGGRDPFEEGLYAATEMFVEPFVRMYERDILTRETYDDVHIQRLVNEGRLGDGVDGDALDALLDAGAIGERLDAEDVAYLKRWGLFRSAVDYDDGRLHVDGTSFPADLRDDDARAAIVEHALGDTLQGGAVLHGGFFLGSKGFYETLRELDEADRRKLRMRSVQFTNQLYGEERLKRLQRRDGRFVNTGLKATVSGGVVSDGLEDNQVISGVGGQFNFVNMAHELDDARSIIMVRATRGSGDDVESNIVWNYGHITIPRHLRDIVVTEYGVADLRDRSDCEVIAEMIKIADSRFQDELVAKAKAANKLPEDWEVPPAYRNNYPETIEERLAPFRERGHLPAFPSGTALTDEEIDLQQALTALQSEFEDPDIADIPELIQGISRETVTKTLRTPDAATQHLERMGLDRPSTPQEFLYKRLVLFALARQDII